MAKIFEENQVFQDFQTSREQFDIAPPVDAKDRQKVEQEMQQRMELFLRGLCSFCPSVDCMKTLVFELRRAWEPLVEVMIPMIFSRFRSLHFGKDDKEKLTEMIREIPFMNCDETAIALLQNQNHPSDAFREREIAHFVNLVTQNSMGGPRAAGPQLQNAARRWLVRYYGRPVDRPMERKEDKTSVNEMSRNEYQIMKRDIREAMRNAMGGWQLILELPCFKIEEDTVRNLLFELSQSYFFKDQDPLLVLDCILDLEKEAEQMKIGFSVQEEIRRIASKSVRDAQEASESDIDSNLLQLLFETPTRLRYYIIENFITLRSAATGLRQLLVNFSIWKLLLSKKWLQAPGIRELPLYNTQQAGMKMLTESAQKLDKGTINLEALHTIIKYRDKYEPLVEQVATRPTAIPESSQKLSQFDTEYKQLRQYLVRFCQPAHIEAAELERVVEGISRDYDSMELNVAAGKFTGLKVRAHLAWLYQLNSSTVFSGIWMQTARPEGGNSERKIEQEEVVNSIIPAARKTWEDLAKSIETGQAILKDIKWVVESTMAQVVYELKLLESTAPKSKAWVAEATELCKSMRLAAKLRLWAPSMLHLRNHSLSEIFKENHKDECVEILNQVVCEYEHMWTKTLGEMTASVTPYKETINTLSEAMQDYTITAAKHDKSLEWLLTRSSTEDFNLLLSLCTPNTDDPIILAAIASLKQMRTFLAEALYTKPPYAGLQKFIEELAKLKVDTAEQQCLESVQTSFDPMLELLTTHSRTPGVQACYDLTKIHLTGTFHVTCALTESAQLKCRMPPESEFDYEALAELRRQLLMTDVPYELDGAKDLPAMLDVLVEKLQLLEDFGRCTMELYRLGHFAYHLNDEVLVVPPEDTVESVAKRLEAQQHQLEDWQQAVSDARSKHYFLNYYTVRELCFLSELLPSVDKDAEWGKVWPLLQCVDLEAEEGNTRQRILLQLKRDLALLRTSSGEPDREVKLLNDVGQMLGDLFDRAAPQVRPLQGLTEVKQQLQGDLLIRSMQNQEQGTPIFVCCADEACKVTELVLSIYTRRERVPEAEELLLCSSHTTLEEIELLLRRFFHARKHQREDRLYCVGNVHLIVLRNGSAAFRQLWIFLGVVSFQGEQRRELDVRSGALRSLLRCAFFLQSSGVALECVPEAFRDSSTQQSLRVFAKLMGFQLVQKIISLHSIWPSRRTRWFALMLPADLDVGSLEGFPVFDPAPAVHDLIPYTLWPVWSMSDENQLAWTEMEKQAYGNPDFGNTNRKVVISEPLPTALHSWGSAVYPCPCSCRRQGFSALTLRRKGLRGIEIVSGLWPHGSRHIHPRELQLFLGFSPCEEILSDCRAQLCLFGNAVSPIQAIWILAHLTHRWNLGNGLTPRECLRQYLTRILLERDVTWPSPSAGSGTLQLDFEGVTHPLLFATNQTGIVLPHFAFLQERTYHLASRPGAQQYPVGQVPVFVVFLGQLSLHWVPASMSYGAVLKWVGIYEACTLLDEASHVLSPDATVQAWKQIVVQQSSEAVVLDLDFHGSLRQRVLSLRLSMKSGDGTW
eukprot:s2426_g2.t1